MLIPRLCRQVLAFLGYNFDDDVALTFENEARIFAGRDGAVLIRPGICSVQMCGYRRRSGEALLMTATARSCDDVEKDDKRLIYSQHGVRVFRHNGVDSETLYVYLPGHPGPWVFCRARRQACDVNLAEMILLFDVPTAHRNRRHAG